VSLGGSVGRPMADRIFLMVSPVLTRAIRRSGVLQRGHIVSAALAAAAVGIPQVFATFPGATWQSWASSDKWPSTAGYANSSSCVAAILGQDCFFDGHGGSATRSKFILSRRAALLMAPDIAPDIQRLIIFGRRRRGC
jgi:hypothetical protein